MTDIIITSLKYADVSETTISMSVTGWLDGETIPFVFHPDDIAPLSRWVKKELEDNGGNYAIAPYSPPVKTNEQLKADIDSYRDQRLDAGYVDAATGKTWQCDQRSIGLWTAIAASCQPWALGLVPGAQPTVSLIASDNSGITLSAFDAYSLLQGRLMPWVSATMLHGRALKNQVDVGTPPADITVGWPQ